MEKLKGGEYDAIILAKAGLERIGFWAGEYDAGLFTVKPFEPNEMIPAACQGILALECKKDDEEIIDILKGINDRAAFRRFQAERYMFRLMRADCSAAVGVFAEITGEDEDSSNISIMTMYEGRHAERTGKYSDYKELSEEIYRELMGEAL